ncbi:MAG: alpha/beta hydrolase fold domain-containing protein [Halanaerobium sp.]
MTINYLITVITFAFLLFLNYILNTNILLSFLIVLAAAVLLILLKKQILSGLKFFILLIGLLLTIFLLTYFAREDLAVSFRGDLVNEGIKFITHNFNRFSSTSFIELHLKYANQDYNYHDWQPPAGYENNKINLTDSEAYLLKKQDADHKKIIYQLHGGAYISSFSENYNESALNYSKAYDQADVFSLDYRTAPEYEHPAALNDALEGYQYLLDNGYSADKIIIAGDSAGGGLALALAVKIKNLELPAPKALILASPWTDLAAEGRSYQEKIEADAFFGYPEAEKAPRYPLPHTYAGDHNLKDPYLSPAYADLSALPPILIQTGSEEILLSDSKKIAEKAEKEGVEVEFIEYKGMYHNFYILAPSLPESREAWQKIEDFIN